MRKKLALTFFLICMLFISSGLTQVLAQGQGTSYDPPHQKPGPAADKIQFKAVAVELAPAAVEKGEVDIYYFNLKSVAAREIRETAGIDIHQAPATTLSLVLNPAPAPDGELNPFSISEVRSALQSLINRDFVANEIYQGLAVPMTSHLTPFDADFLTVSDTVRQFNIRYDPEFARNVIKDAMTENGAELRDGRWFFDDQPISLRFIVRVEDERREIGDLIAAELDNLGFTVERTYQTFGPAIFKVYGTDPIAFEWHLYTEGWGRGSVERFDFANINQMYAPWLGNMPGWQEFGYWQFENRELDEIGQRIFQGDFSDVNERNELYQQATSMGISDSVRIWIAAVVNSFPGQSGIQGITQDVAIGPKSLFTLRDIYIPGNDIVKIGNLWVWTERTTWNPIGGFTDVYSSDIWRGVYDPPIVRNPFTGIPMPYRATYDIVTAGPDGNIAVPDDAFLWDSEKKGWKTVGPGVQTTSKVTIDYEKYFASKWHHGESMGMEDVLYGIFQSFDLVNNPEKSKIEVAIATTSKPFLDTFKGFRVLNSTSLEVYVDFWHFVPDYIADYAQPTGLSMPWEVLAAMDDIVFGQRKAAYSSTSSVRFQVPWISLVADRDARLVRTTMMRFSATDFVPEGVFKLDGEDLVNSDQARQRYDSAVDWFDKYGILVVSNGPYQLTTFDPPAQFAELTAFRDPTYPFKPGDWFFGSPSLPEIVNVSGTTLFQGAEGDLLVETRGPSNLQLKYSLINPASSDVLAWGEGNEVGEGNHAIVLPSSITSDLDPGTYQIVISAISDDVSYVAERAEILRIERAVAPAETAPIVETVPSDDVKATEQEDLSKTSMPTPISQEETESNFGVIAIVASLLILVVAGFIIFKRRGRMPKA